MRPGPACVQPSWGVFVRGNLPREAVGRVLGGREPAKTLLLRSRRGGRTMARGGGWCQLPRAAECDKKCICDKKSSENGGLSQSQICDLRLRQCDRQKSFENGSYEG